MIDLELMTTFPPISLCLPFRSWWTLCSCAFARTVLFMATTAAGGSPSWRICWVRSRGQLKSELYRWKWLRLQRSPSRLMRKKDTIIGSSPMRIGICWNGMALQLLKVLEL